MNPGRLVCFEGLDGSGKSTQLRLAAQWLRAEGHDVLETCEPTTGDWGRRIRTMARSGDLIAPEEELRWFIEDRREHVAGELAPALAAGRIVLTDRYYLSSVAYQGARGLDWKAILTASEAEFPVPDLALVFELPAALGLERVRARGGAAEPAFERLDFLERVAGIFGDLDLPYVVRVDASASQEDVAASTRRILSTRIGS